MITRCPMCEPFWRGGLHEFIRYRVCQPHERQLEGTNERRRLEKYRSRSIMAAFQTGRPVFGDSDGVLKFADNNETVGDDVGWTGAGVPPATTVKPSWWTRLKARLRR